MYSNVTKLKLAQNYFARRPESLCPKHYVHHISRLHKIEGDLCTQYFTDYKSNVSSITATSSRMTWTYSH